MNRRAVSHKAKTTHIKQVEALREKWIPKAQRIVLAQLRPMQTMKPSEIIANLPAQRDQWVTMLSNLYVTAAAPFAEQTLKSLASRAGIEDYSFAKDKRLKAAYTGFMQTYIAQRTPAYVDKVFVSIGSHIVDALKSSVGESKRKKDTVTETDSPDDPSSGLSSEQDDADTWEEGISAPTFDDLIDDVFLGIALTAATMAILLACGLGALAAANAFSQAQDMELVKQWQAIEDKETRPDHSDADGQEQALSDPFQVGDSQLMFPLDDSMGADISEIIYCRCVVVFDIASAKRRILHLDWADRIAETVISTL